LADGSDGLMILGSNRNYPRMELIANSGVSGTQGSVSAVYPGIDNAPVNASALPQPGDLMMLIGSNVAPVGTQKVALPVYARLVRVATIGRQSLTNPTRTAIQITYDLCGSGSCGQPYGQLINTTQPTVFVAGSTLVPISITTIYQRLINGQPGVVISDLAPSYDPQSNSFIMDGSHDQPLGNISSLSFNYRLQSGSTYAVGGQLMPTPTDPLVPWLNDITSVQVTVSRSVAPALGHTPISRTETAEFPVSSQVLQFIN
jgi:hypothetical protein